MWSDKLSKSSASPIWTCVQITQLWGGVWEAAILTSSRWCQWCWSMGHIRWAHSSLVQASGPPQFQKQLHAPEPLTYLKAVLKRRFLIIIQGVMEHLLCWTLVKRWTWRRLPLPSWGSHSIRGDIQKESSQVAFWMLLWNAAGPGNLAQTITVDFQEEMTFLQELEGWTWVNQLLRNMSTPGIIGKQTWG